MRVAIAYPPLPSEKGVPLLSQNRQFQWFNRPTYIYPVVPAQAATMLKQSGYEVGWLDGIAAEWSVERFESELRSFGADLVVIESKTPVIRRHWEYIGRLKELFPAMVVVLVGDHITAYPDESINNSQVDYLLTGGDYDFLLLNLCTVLRDAGKGVVDTSRFEAGIYWRNDSGGVASSGPFKLDHNLSELPWIDRDLTRWQLYAVKNGNFRSTPGTYIMAGRDCWHGKCTFCSWTTLYPSFRVRDPVEVVDEIGQLIERYGVREIMDDTGCLPVGGWLRQFCDEMIARGYNKRVRIDCNMRFGKLGAEEYQLMRRAGFRLVLFGLESANQETLDRLCKGVQVAEIEEGARAAARAGLSVHVTVMFGYPWEGEEEIERTVALARRLLRKGHASTLQVTMLVPYPGTPLYRELESAGLLRVSSWDDYDMRQQVMQAGVSEEYIKRAVRRVYRSFLHPETLARRLVATREPLEDLKFYWRGFLSLLGHLRDFGG